METIIKNGNVVNVNYASKAFQDKMHERGWRIEIRKDYGESAQHLYDRLAATGCYKDIKVYWDSTMIRGLHTYFAFVKYN